MARRLFLFLSLLLFSCVSASATQNPELPPPRVIERTQTPFRTDTAAPTFLPSPTTAIPSTESPTAPPPTDSPTTAPTLAVPASTAASAPTPVTLASTTAPVAAGSAHDYSRPIIIANYLAWYDTGSWSSGCTSDSPSAGAYNSDDGGTISRHISLAQSAGLDGFAVHWGGPGDRTDANLANILGQGFGATVNFLNHFFYGVATRATVASSLSYIINTYTGSGSWIRYAGKPVLLFADMTRIDTSGGLTPQQAWESVRNSVDPNHNTLWIAEGLDPSYLKVFDGLYVYRIDHNCCPVAYQSAGKWSGWVRDAEKLYGPRYWVATIQPGWNDSLTSNPACNGVRVSAEPFARDREGGAYYQRTVNSAFSTTPDMIIVNSFNEWVEGSFIEPSAGFGDLYITLTAQYAGQFHSSR